MLLLLSLPAQAQVDRSSVDLNSRRHTTEHSLPKGWLKPESEPEALKWNYRQEQAVRRVCASIKLDAREIVESGKGHNPVIPGIMARAELPLETVPAKSDPAEFELQHKAESGEGNPAIADAAEEPDSTESALAPAEPEETAEAAAVPEETAEAAVAEADTENLSPAIVKEAPEEFTPKYDFRIKPKPEPVVPEEVPEEPSAESADLATDSTAPDAFDALQDSSALIDQALSSLKQQTSGEPVDTGFIPDSVPQKSVPRRELMLVPSQGRLAEQGSQAAPLLPQLAMEHPGLPEFEIRSDMLQISRGNSKLHQVALTFDDGPHPQYTAQILAILDYYNAPATFFFVGVQSSRYPEWLLMAHQQGHEIASQTYDHFRLPKLPQNEKEYQIDTYQDLVEQLTGERPRFLRPPGGQIDDASLALLKQRGMVCAMWDVALNDTHGDKTREELLQHTLDSVRNGSVILAHDGVQATIDMLPELIEKLREEGYEFVTMSQLASGL